MDLNTSIEELKLALQNSDAFCRYQKIREEVHHYPEKEHRLHEFRRKNYFLQNSKDQIDLFTEAGRLEQEYADVYKDPLLGEYLAAEVTVCRIIQQINKELLGCLNFEAILYEE
ncbi:YlbF family regulator [uncultured Eubacterium sp.]|mgnify:CR=1 FL=1|uniref:YlbF family regulator n=1 Tax=uncultured Eubacterium sp. TaxID=165185 RepID=UPI0015AE239F|nr:YlbF family regulator [uncultured Eubacterium sp.]